MMFMERKPPTPRRIKSQAASHSLPERRYSSHSSRTHNSRRSQCAASRAARWSASNGGTSDRLSCGMSSRPTICNMRGDRQNATTEGDKAEQQNAATGEPHAALPPRRRKSMANTAHHQHGGEGPQSKRRHGEKSGKRSGSARCLGNEGIDQGTRQEAVEHPKGKRRSAAACRQQAAQGYGKRAAGEAARKAMK